MGHNSPQYVHTVAQAIELAMADREAYTADPAFVAVPMDEIMSQEYAAQRRAKMTEHAFGPLPAPGVLSRQSFTPSETGAQAETETAARHPSCRDRVQKRPVFYGDWHTRG
jgi:gamma-glutamyltranspeptidase/glutathione hydrolase